MPLVNPFLRISCPYCREKFHPGDCAIYSTVTPGKLLRAAPTPGTMEYRLSRTLIEELNGPAYVSELARRECPHCQKLLFEGIETCENINIAIVGDTSSGKTHYIAALIDQLKHGILMQNGNGVSSLLHLNVYTATTYADRYYRPIFIDRSAVPGSQPGYYDASGRPVKTEPLVYQFSLQDRASGTSFTINLLFYDISGEDFADNIKLVLFGEHVLRADGIIYLADPLAMSNLRQQLPPELQSLSVSQRTPHEVLETVLFRLRGYKKIRPDGEIAIPTAFVVSKSDLLQYVIPASEHQKLWFMHQPPYDGKAHLEQFNRVDGEIRYCLQVYREFPLLRMSQSFIDASFFAASATGSPPDSSGKYSSINPLRCLDPFIWLLWKLNYIDAVR